MRRSAVISGGLAIGAVVAFGVALPAAAISGSIGCPPDTTIVVSANTTHTGSGSWTTLLEVGKSTSPNDLIVKKQINNQNGSFAYTSSLRGNAWGVDWASSGGTFTRTQGGGSCT